MNFFRKRYQKKLRVVWGIISVLVIISMVALYAGFLAGGSTGAPAAYVGDPEVVPATDILPPIDLEQ
jgi:hypothetical protein